MKRKDNSLKIVVYVLVAIMLMCTVLLIAARTQREKEAEDPIARPTYMGQEIFSTRWRG